MAVRSSWEGFLKLSLISIPVRAYNAAVPGGGDIHFHQLHKGCGSRIRYQKVCPIHGVVTKDDIVSGYEYEKNAYVELDSAEIARLRAPKNQSIDIDAFVPEKAVNPLYLSGRTFYLVPEGAPGQKPYQLLHQIMEQKGRNAVATIILGGHEETVLVRPEGKLLTMTVLYYENQIKKPADFEDELSTSKISPTELKLAETLVDASTTKKFTLGDYKDLFNERTREIIEAKLAGRKVTPGRTGKEPRIINLMDALKKSVQDVQEKRTPPRRAAKTSRRRKTG